jgi:RNA polymerase sigma-70 factor (ECF subfamily)
MSLSPDTVVQVLLRGRVRITALANAILHDPHAADDVFQHVVLSALEYRDQFADDAHVLPWALRAARFRAIDAGRKRRVQTLPAVVLDRLECRWADPDADDPADRLAAMTACLDGLPAPSRDLLRWRYDEGLTVPAISARLNRTPDAVYQTLSRLHRGLRACVERRLPAAEWLGGRAGR